MTSDPRAALEALLDLCHGCGCLQFEHAHRAMLALRAALTLHKPGDDGDCLGCGLTAWEEPTPWPCRTTKAITTALEGKA